MNLRTNRDKLVKISVMGQIDSPTKYITYNISYDGVPRVLPGIGGITYNVRVGDLACGWQADHVEPGVSTKNFEKVEGRSSPNLAYNVLACIGNEAIVVTGDAKGSRGYVIGKHGGIEHVLIDFPPEVLDKLVIGDKILVKAYGVGPELLDYPDIKVMNLSPELLNKMGIVAHKDKLQVPVTHIIPAEIMGSGLGSDNAYRGDYDIQLFDETVVKKYGLEDLRLGDIIAIKDADTSFGRFYKKGAMTIGIVVHTNSYIAGHGPGVTSLLTSSDGRIIPKIDPNANIKNYLGL